jgi:hypothetical protein
MPIDHVAMNVTDLDRSKAFYSYCAAFVRDADGNNVQAVTHKPE